MAADNLHVDRSGFIRRSGMNLEQLKQAVRKKLDREDVDDIAVELLLFGHHTHRGGGLLRFLWIDHTDKTVNLITRGLE